MTQPTPDSVVASYFDTIIKATETNDYDLFRSVGDHGFQTGIMRENFEHVSHEVAPHLGAGYTTQYLGVLTQDEHRVHLWKIVFTEDIDDILARMSVKDERVTGILFTQPF